MTGQLVLNPRQEKRQRGEAGEEEKRERVEGFLYSEPSSHAQLVLNAAEPDSGSDPGCCAELLGSSEFWPSTTDRPLSKVDGFNPVTAPLQHIIIIIISNESSRKEKLRHLNASQDSAAVSSYSRSAVVSMSVAAAAGWAEMMSVWRETPTTPPPLPPPLPPPSLPPSRELHFCKVAAESWNEGCKKHFDLKSYLKRRRCLIQWSDTPDDIVLHINMSR